jgi:hypothetical protein
VRVYRSELLLLFGWKANRVCMLTPEELLVACIGVSSPEKGILAMIEHTADGAAAILADCEPPWLMLFELGGVSSHCFLKRKAQYRGHAYVNSCIEWSQASFQPLLSNKDMMAWRSRSTGLPMERRWVHPAMQLTGLIPLVT